LAATGRILTESDKTKISIPLRGIKLSDETRARISASTIALIGVSVIVKNVKTDAELHYASLTDAAKAIGVSRTAVRKALDTGRTVKGQYVVATKKLKSILLFVKWIAICYLGRRTLAQP